MLTIEEQIERIADHAFESANDRPRRTTRRWPALVAAVALVTATGAAVWGVLTKDPPRSATEGLETTSSIATRLEGVEEFRLTAGPIIDDQTGVVIERPNSLATVETPDGVTVFRVTGVQIVPGFAAYEGRCAGIPRRGVSCELPGLADVPWIIDESSGGGFAGRSIWVDVPLEVKAILLTDGERQLFQRPVNGLGVWPAPTNADWTVQALDSSGRTIATLDQSTIDERQASAPTTTDTSDRSAEESRDTVRRFRDCLARQGAKFGDDGTRPIFPDGIDTTGAWTRCLTGLTPPAGSTTVPGTDDSDVTVVMPTSTE
jgi:hypothetical protein